MQTLDVSGVKTQIQQLGKDTTLKMNVDGTTVGKLERYELSYIRLQLREITWGIRNSKVNRKNEWDKAQNDLLKTTSTNYQGNSKTTSSNKHRTAKSISSTEVNLLPQGTKFQKAKQPRFSLNNQKRI